jgi:predicted Fe-S protein YdhL (DUF1289 family)
LKNTLDKNLNSRSESPCVRNCCLDNNDLCLGCFRYIDEITSWQSYSEQEKRQVLEQCHYRRADNEHSS